jgi:hypothetical protein
MLRFELFDGSIEAVAILRFMLTLSVGRGGV